MVQFNPQKMPCPSLQQLNIAQLFDCYSMVYTSDQGPDSLHIQGFEVGLDCGICISRASWTKAACALGTPPSIVGW